MPDADAIIAAARAGDYARVSLLLDGDPSLATAMNLFGSQPVHAAHFGGHTRVFDLLVSRGVEIGPFLAAELGMLDRVQAALRENPQFAREFSAQGSTALHRACYWGQVASARLLLEHGADADAPTRDSFLQIRPLGSAVATPDVPNPSDREEVVLELVRLLLDRGAGVNGRRRDGLTALHSAAYRGHLSVIRLLLDRGADPSIRGFEGAGPHSGQTAAEMAVSQGQHAAADLLAQTEPRP
jgi:ankyrin repeat protein